MPDSTLLLIPVAILVVVSLLGFCGCSADKWPGGSGNASGSGEIPSGSGQTHLTLKAEASLAGPGLHRITSASFTLTGNPVAPPQSAPPQVSTKSDSLWAADFYPGDSPWGPWTVTVAVSVEDAEKKEHKMGPTDFHKVWSLGAEESWAFCVHYDPGDVGSGKLEYELEDCSPG